MKFPLRMSSMLFCASALFAAATLNACSRTTEHVFIDNANRCSSPKISLAFDNVQNNGDNTLGISPMEVKSALLQAFDENGCIGFSPSSPHTASATYITQLATDSTNKVIFSNDTTTAEVVIVLHVQTATKRQTIEGRGQLALSNDKVLGLGANNQLNLADKNYALSVASRSLAKAYSDKLLTQD